MPVRHFDEGRGGCTVGVKCHMGAAFAHAQQRFGAGTDDRVAGQDEIGRGHAHPRRMDVLLGRTEQHMTPGRAAFLRQTGRVLRDNASAFKVRRHAEQLADGDDACAAYAGHDLLTLSRMDVAFHQAIADAAHNVLFAHLSSSLLSMLKTHVRDNIANLFDVAPVSGQLLAQHRAIWQAIHERNPQAARAAAEAHIDFVDQTLNVIRVEHEREERAMRRAQAVEKG